MFEKTLYVGWADLDFNGHMKNTAYLDKCVDVRMMYFAEHGFSMREFYERRFGPVVRRDEIEYFRELRLLDPMRVTLEAGSMTEDGARFSLVNTFYRADGTLVARVTSSGGWMNLDQRKLMPPPDELRALLEQMPRAETFELLAK